MYLTDLPKSGTGPSKAQELSVLRLLKLGLTVSPPVMCQGRVCKNSSRKQPSSQSQLLSQDRPYPRWGSTLTCLPRVWLPLLSALTDCNNAMQFPASLDRAVQTSRKHRAGKTAQS